jgi:predicted membrane-bound mannosyltransferase
MAVSGKGTDEWRLGIEPGGHDGPQASEETGAVRNYSAERLERPLWVVTAEHLGWAMLGCLALASRFVMLGARPLDSAEARYALSELALLHSGPPAGTHLTWVHLLEAAVFAALGAGDFAARMVFALSGLLLVATGFALRRHLGRAGGMAFAALLVLSPSVAYFSRAAHGVVPALAFAMLALSLFLELIDEPGRLIAAGLGAAAGLGFATGGAALMTALFMLAALAVVGLVDALAGARVRLQVQVWWARRKVLFLITILVAAVVWLGCESDFFTGSPLYAIAAAFRSNFESTGQRGFVAGLDFYLPMFSLYEFLVVLLALIGALGVLTLRIRSRLAAGALVWSALAVAFYLWTPARAPAFVLQMIVPMALLGAFVIQYLHHAIAWSIIRYPLAVLALLTLYVQMVNNFVWYAPDASQAPWARTALLYWTEPATTLQAPVECARVMALLPPAGASAFFATDSPVLRWYLRALTPAVKADGAAAIVGGVEPASLYEAQGLTTYEFELSDVWHPAWRSLSPVAALHYLLRARVWTPLESHRVTIAVRPNIPVAPTVIFAPVEPPPAGSAAPPAPSAPAAPGAAAPAAPSAPAESSTPTTPESAPSGSPADNPASDPSGNPGADTPGNGPG